ncbi:MAG: PHP domain-containing protein [Rickettsiales bacterium]|jgi:predicted metal-dependent phosphoesterase TrpH|nr:PHP domain-containing protein [Rickettsiales bacterium]
MVDLHTHSIFSDGYLSPTELLQKASDNGLSALALTDHDTTSGLAEFLESSKKFPNIKAIPGCKFSCISPFELHILAINIKNIDKISKYTKKIDEQGFIYAKEKVEYLNNIGIDATFEELTKGVVGSFRPDNIVRYLIKKGIVKTEQEGYHDYKHIIGHEIRNPANEVIETILSADAIPILAHPKRTKLKNDEIRVFLKELVNLGLKGIECYHSRHEDEEIEFYLGLAKEFGLVVSGGSDFHGDGRVEIGTGSKNKRKIPHELLNFIL